jgi:O-antigen/teichoic acid export membrane protein
MSASVVSRAAGLGALTAAGQLVVIGSLPLYSRVFDPSIYGEFVIFVGATTVVSVFAGLRYDSAIVLPRSEPVAAALTTLVMLIALGVAALLMLVASGAALWAPASILGGVFGLGLAVATALGGLQRCFTSWCVRGNRFLRIGIGQFALALTTVLAQLAFARFMAQLPALVWGYVCALLVQSVCVAPPARFGEAWLHGASWRGMRLAARKYRRFPTYMVGYALASTVRDRLIQIVLGIGAGTAAVGRFALAYRVAFAPNSLIYSAVSPVFYSIASRGSRASVGAFAAGLVEAAFVMLLVPYVAFAMEAPALADQLLSERWHGTGPYLRALAAPAFMLAATCWLDRAFDSFRRQNVAFALEASFTVASVVLVAALSRFLEPVSVAWAFGALGLVYYWIYFLTTFLACGFPLRDFRHVCRTGVIAAGATLALGALIHQLDELLLRVLVYAILMVAVVGGWARFGGGAVILRALMRSRVGDPVAAQQWQR